jgi:hypothetical protein
VIAARRASPGLVIWVLSGLVAATLFATLLLSVLHGIPTSAANWDGPLVAAGLSVTTIAFSVVGVMIGFKRPGNRVAWVSLVIGFGLSATALAGELKAALHFRPDPLAGATVVVWLENWIWTIPIGLLGTLYVLLFPDGRLPSPRWRPTAWLSVMGIVLASGAGALEPGSLSDSPGVVNPYGLEGADELLDVLNLGFALLPLCFVASAAALVTRFRKAGGDERLQLKWFALSAVVLALSFGFYMLAPASILGIEEERSVPLLEGFISFAFAGLPLAAGIAVLKYRLYDIDRIINSTITYGVLTGVLVAVYSLCVVVLSSVVGMGDASKLVVAASTLLVAALFQPARRRIQILIDRRFHRNRFDAQATLDAFSTRLRSEVQLDEISNDLLGVVRRTVQPSHASLWLSSDFHRRMPGDRQLGARDPLP